MKAIVFMLICWAVLSIIMQSIWGGLVAFVIIAIIALIWSILEWCLK